LNLRAAGISRLLRRGDASVGLAQCRSCGVDVFTCDRGGIVSLHAKQAGQVFACSLRCCSSRSDICVSLPGTGLG
jgi:hypothetical protein